MGDADCRSPPRHEDAKILVIFRRITPQMGPPSVVFCALSHDACIFCLCGHFLICFCWLAFESRVRDADRTPPSTPYRLSYTSFGKRNSDFFAISSCLGPWIGRKDAISRALFIYPGRKVCRCLLLGEK